PLRHRCAVLVVGDAGRQHDSHGRQPGAILARYRRASRAVARRCRRGAGAAGHRRVAAYNAAPEARRYWIITVSARDHRPSAQRATNVIASTITINTTL